MKKMIFSTLSIVVLALSGCSKMPKECNDAWDKLEKLASQMGIPEEQLKTQKEQFEKEIQAMDREQATEQCKMQNSIMGMVGQ